MGRFRLAPFVLIFASLAWAGREFPALAGEQFRTGELLIRLHPGETPSVILSYLPAAVVTPLPHLNLYHVHASSLPPNVVAALAADARVDFVEPNRIRHARLGPPNDPDFSQQWPLANLGAVQAWSLFPNDYLISATAGTGRLQVAVLDTGIDCTHPDFMNTGASSTNSAFGGQILWSASQAFVATTLSSPTCPWQDDFGHGTHVSGIIAASANNNVGVAGLAYPVQLVAYKVLDNTGAGSDAVISEAIMAAADAGIPIQSMSFGGAGYSQTLQLAINYAWKRNSLVIAAAGNSATNQLFFPSGANYAVGVSATDINSNLASFSNFGNSVELAGPGVNVLSTLPAYPVTLSNPTGYGMLSGTSMSTPHASAVAALVASTSPGTSAAAILLRVEQTATSTTQGGGWNQDFGYGIVNAYAAVSGTLRSAANGAVTGQVTDVNGNPIGTATVTVGASSLGTSAYGLFRIAPLAAGTYSVQVSAPSYLTQNLTVTVPPGADAVLPVVMGVSYGEFTGTVTNGVVAVPNAIVQAISSNLIQGTAIADTSGHYALWVPAGTYNLLVTNVGSANKTITGQTVAAFGNTTVNLTMPQLGSIAGTVTGPTGTPVNAATVSITGGMYPITVVTGANGQFSVTSLASGTYTLACSDSGFTTTTLTGLAVSAGSATNGNCQLGSATSGWYNSAWSYRKPITINSTLVSGSSNLTNFPVLISLPLDANLSASAQSSGNDILFTDSSGTSKLNHQIETYVSGTGQLLAWVQVPSVSPTTNTIIYLYYGNPSATNQQNANGVWDSNYQTVLHLPNGTTLTTGDSTSNGHNGTSAGATAVSGQIDGGAGLNGSSQYIDVPMTVNYSQLTVSVWWNVGSYAGRVIANSHTDADGNGFQMEGGAGNPGTGFFDVGAGSVVTASYALGGFTLGSWHYFVGTYDGTNARYYVDGVLQGTSGATSGPVRVSGIDVNVGRNPAYAGDYIGGNVDEVRISSTARPAGWIGTEYNNQKSPTNFSTPGTQQINTGGTVGITVTSAPVGLTVTVDGVTCAVTPCGYQWTPGTGHTLAAATQAGTAGTQYVFANWTGNAGSPDSVTAPSSSSTYTATFTTQYMLTTSANPSNEGSINPVSEWVNSGAGVQISATANAGDQFTGFSGALTGTTTPQSLTMTGPASVTANFSVVSGGPGWYNSAWSYRKPITINSTLVSGSSNLTNFPVLISLPLDANLASSAQSNGNDILFTDSSGTSKLNHQIETYVSGTGQLLAWVQVPSVSPTTNTIIYLYYGNPSATNQQNANGVWDSNYQTVLHLPNGTTLTTGDSTSNGHNGTSAGATAVSGQIDGGAGLNGSSQYIDVPMTVNYSQLTVSVWWNVGSYAGRVIANSHTDADGNGFQMEGGAGNPGTGFFDVGAGSVVTASYALGGFTLGSWHYFVGTYDGTNARYYVDGVLQGTSGATSGPVRVSGIDVNVGRNPAYAGDYIGGNVDEVRISSTARPAGWIGTEYNNQKSPTNFSTPGTQQINTGGTVGITVTSAPVGLTVTVDGVTCAVTPCGYQWTPGTGHTLAAATQAGTAGTQYVFANWTGNAGSPDSVTAPSSSSTYTATFTTQYMLTTSANPSNEGSINPVSEWVNSGAGVQISATANAGDQFTGFSGALTGTTTPQSLTMTGPASVTANFSVVSGGPGWYNSAWSYRKPITINSTLVSGSSNLTNFPVLISLPLDANLASSAQSNGNDILFTDSSGTSKLNHQIETYVSGTGQLLAWVQVPSVSPTTNTIIYLYYGNPSATNQQNASGVWDSNYQTVLHLPNGTTLTTGDSTSNGHNGTSAGATAVSGQIDGGAGLNGSSQYIDVPMTVNYSQLTVSVWWNVGSYAGRVIANSHTDADGNGFQMEGGAGNPGTGFFDVGAGSVVTASYALGGFTLGSWHYFVGTYDGTNARYYVDGVLQGTSGATSGPVRISGIDVNVGRNPAYAGDYIGGNVDEVRISSTARPAGWIGTEYNNQKSPTNFSTPGPQQTNTGG